MAVTGTRLSQIAPATAPPALTDQLVGVTGGAVDQLFTLAQVQTAVGGGGGGTTPAPVGIPIFPTPGAAQQGTIADTVNYLQVAGNKLPGDGGAGTYQRVSSLPSIYVGDGSIPAFVPPSFTSGGLPINVFTTTFTNLGTVPIGPSSAPILAGDLAIMVVFGADASPASHTDSAGNVYILAYQNTSFFGIFCVYYCANPVFAPVGTTFNIQTAFDTPRNVYIYTCPGFTGAVFDKVAAAFLASALTGITVTSPTLTATPELALGIIDIGNGPESPNVPFPYTPPVGWSDLSPPHLGGRQGVTCIVTSLPTVTFNPTWDSSANVGAGGSPAAIAYLLTFKTYPKPTLDASFWSLLPTAPLHTAAFGVDPAAPDNVGPFRAFGRYLATTAAPSGGMQQARAGTPSTGTVTISIANPAVITVTPDSRLINMHGLHAGEMISFSTTGNLPTGIVPGQIYYVQYGSVAPTSFQISSTPLFDPVPGVSGGAQTQPKGVPIATTGTQSGTHSYTTYGQSWTDFVLDPGTYYASQNQALGMGTGLQKVRMFAYGARLATNTDFAAAPANDINATATGTSTFAYTTQFQSTIEVHNSGNFNNYVVLNTPAKAVNFYVNSWVVLMAINMQASADGNWNPAIFEYAQIKSIDLPSGTITFWDDLQYNYRSTYPAFLSPSNATTGGLDGPGTIVQMSDVFDQEVEVHGLNLFGVTECTVGGILSLRFVDCDFWGWAFDSGPSPVFARRYIVENCRFHNCVPEIDKMVDFVLYRDCDFDQTSFARFQSASINKAVFDRCKMMGGFSGTPKDLTIRDSFIAGTFTYGPVYGSTQRMTLINTHIQRILNNDQASTTLQFSSVTFVNGTIKIASGTNTIYGTWNPASLSNVCPAPWAQPGAKICITPADSVNTAGSVDPTNHGGTCGMIACFTILDVYQDGAGAFCIDTSMAALPSMGFTVTGTVSGNTLTVTATNPANAFLLRGMGLTGGTLPVNTVVTADIGMPGLSTGTFTLNNAASIGTSTTFTVSTPMAFLPHPCPRLTMINCTGGRFATDMAGAPPDIPMHSYFRRAYGGATLASDFHDDDLNIAGNLLTLTINVLRPYTGAGASYICDLQIGGFATSGGVTYPTFLTQTINLKTAGIRTITAVATSGGVAGDTIAAIPFWISGRHQIITGILPNFTPNPADTIANMPYFIVTAQTDQGVDFATITVNTQTGGRPAGIIDTFADTTTMVGQPF